MERDHPRKSKFCERDFFHLISLLDVFFIAVKIFFSRIMT